MTRLSATAVKNFLFDQYLRGHRQAEELIKRGNPRPSNSSPRFAGASRRIGRTTRASLTLFSRPIAAFLNTEGGDLLIGVADDGSVVGIEHDQLENDDKFMRHLTQVVRNALGRSRRHVHRSDRTRSSRTEASAW